VSTKRALERERLENSRYITSASAKYWRVELIDEVVSTQLEFPERLAQPDANRVVVAEYQGLTFSVGFIPKRHRQEWSWLPLLLGSAIASSLNDHLFSAEVVATKWPNDIVDVSGRKFGGILTQLRGDGLVAGIGINVLESEEELAVPHAISLAMVSTRVKSGEISREDVLAIILDGIRERYQYWLLEGSDEKEIARYREGSLTLREEVTREVRCELPGGRVIEGRVRGIKTDGSLLVEDEVKLHEIHVADVIHLR
jgi:BirA family biotin operon repressor/biotin-[acetyl-CoA-carboxylase] ligase